MGDERKWFMTDLGPPLQLLVHRTQEGKVVASLLQDGILSIWFKTIDRAETWARRVALPPNSGFMEMPTWTKILQTAEELDAGGCKEILLDPTGEPQKGILLEDLIKEFRDLVGGKHHDRN